MKSKPTKPRKIMPRSIIGERTEYKTDFGKLREITKSMYFKKRDAKSVLKLMKSFMKTVNMNDSDLGIMTFRVIKQ